MEENSTEELSKKYYSYGFQQREILAFLKHFHDIQISSRTLKRILSKQQLYRRKKYSRIEDVMKFLESELMTSGQLNGYRWMHLRCLQNNFIVTQNVVRELLSYLDPQGVEIRKRKRLRRRQYHNKGPNFLWHVDSYDKLKPYGICINGCIDGFSRHIIWLRSGSTSSDPKMDLDQVVMEWNVHKIRKSRNSISPSGRPTIMFEMPSLYEAQNYSIKIPHFIFEAVTSEYTFSRYPCDEDVYDLCKIFMMENEYKFDSDPYHAIELYINLRRLMKNSIEQ